MDFYQVGYQLGLTKKAGWWDSYKNWVQGNEGTVPEGQTPRAFEHLEPGGDMRRQATERFHKERAKTDARVKTQRDAIAKRNAAAAKVKERADAKAKSDAYRKKMYGDIEKRKKKGLGAPGG